jgi:RNA polymerase sigma-70 factor (ECF subfamily)
MNPMLGNKRPSARFAIVSTKIVSGRNEARVIRSSHEKALAEVISPEVSSRSVAAAELLLAQDLDRSVVSEGMTSDLEERLRVRGAVARNTWPGIDVDPAAFARHVFERLPHAGVAALDELHLDDLYLACACLHGFARALAALEQRVIANVPRFLGRMGLTAEAMDELCQTLRHKLLVPLDGAPPKLAGYSGRGALAGWVRIIAVRMALAQRKASAARPPGRWEDLDALAARQDPELALLTSRYRRELEVALCTALARLGARERTLLGRHLVDGISAEELAELHGVHRATATRWLRRAEDRLRDSVSQELALSGNELSWLVGTLHADLDIDLAPLEQRC